jgi:hypothetical protein
MVERWGGVKVREEQRAFLWSCLLGWITCMNPHQEQGLGIWIEEEVIGWV